MLTYKAAFKFVDGGVHAQVLDFPEAISCGVDLDEARKMIASALVELAELRLEQGQPLPVPNPFLIDPEADLEEPLHLHLQVSSGARILPEGVIVP